MIHLLNHEDFTQDLMASVVVFLVATPLCLGIALACGLSPTEGLISGIIGGIVVGAMGGCKLQVSGPAAGLITVVWSIVHTHGPESLGWLVLLAGLIQIGFSLLHMGQWFRAVSPAVIRGMLAGIGVLILVSQFHVMVDDVPKASAIENLLSIPNAVVKGLTPIEGSSHHLAAGIGVLTILVIVAWKFIPKKFRLFPAPLAAVVTAVSVSAFLQLPINTITVPENIFNEINWLSFGNISFLFSGSAMVSALTIAIIASAESLLTATAVDQMQDNSRTNYNKELMAQGVGNCLAGVFGAIPITGVIVRSSANVQAGAVSRLSSVLHGVWILLFLLLFPFVLGWIPTSSLAAILVYTGCRMINLKDVKNFAKFGRLKLIIYFATIIAIVMTNLLEGILIGFTLSIIKLFYYQTRLTINVEQVPDTYNAYAIEINGSANFITLPQLAEVLESQPEGRKIHIGFGSLNYIDQACMELLIKWREQYIKEGGSVWLDGDFLGAKFSKVQVE